MPDTREMIIDAAGELFMTLPYHKVTMDKVRNRVGVGKGTIYRHFDGKEDLYCKVVLYELDGLLDSLRETTTARDAAPHVRLRELSQRLAGFFQWKKPLFALLRSEELRGSQTRKKLFRQWKERRSQLTDVFEKVIREGVECGHYSTEIPTRTAAAFLLAMLKSGSRKAGTGDNGTTNNEYVVNYAMHLFENGMGKGKK